MPAFFFFKTAFIGMNLPEKYVTAQTLCTLPLRRAESLKVLFALAAGALATGFLVTATARGQAEAVEAQGSAPAFGQGIEVAEAALGSAGDAFSMNDLARMLNEVVHPAEPATAPEADEKGRQDVDAAMRVPSVEEMPVLGHTVTLDLRGVTLDRALERIAGAVGVRVAYLRETANAGSAVTLAVDRTSARVALASALEGTSLRLVRASDAQLVLVPRAARTRSFPAARRTAIPTLKKMKAATPRALRNEAPMQGVIAGTIVDGQTGTPIPGVNVLVEDMQLGAATDAEGAYEIVGVEPGTYTVAASFVGYGRETKRGVEVQDGETTTVDFELQQQAAGLDEVIVVGYGERQRGELTGSVSSISTEDIEEAPAPSVEQALQGRAAGVQVTQSSGQPGSGSTVRIRGGSSLEGGNEPLYVIDGVPVYNDVEGSNAGGLLNTQPSNPLANLSPNDIESIEILKDASATAIYGTRGSNGVVLITTKSGASGRSQVDFNARLGYQEVRNQLDLLNASEFAGVVNEARANEGQDPLYTDADIANMGEGTDWQDEVFRSAPVQEYTLSFSGSDDDTQYYVSGNFFDQEGVVIGSDFRKGGLRVNLDQDISDSFRIGTHLTASRSGADASQTRGGIGFQSSQSSIVGDALSAPPTLPVRSADGSYFLESNPVTGRRLSNPVAAANEVTNEDQKDRVIGDVFAEYDILEGLTAKVTGGLDYLDNTQEYYAPRTTTLQGLQFNGIGRIGNLETSTWINENTLRYDRLFGERHDLGLLGGVTFQGSSTANTIEEAQDFSTDALRQNALQGGAERTDIFSQVTEWGLVSYLGRANYTFDDRYLLTLTGRVDGSSRFGKGNRYGFFPSGALAWRVSEEPFFEDVDAVSNLKVRTSYGRTGNQEIGLYRALATLGTVDYTFGDGGRAVGFAPSGVANPDLKWETTDQLDIGLDLGLFDQRVNLTADYYFKQTDDLILDVVVPQTSGFSTSLQNVGSVQNRGFELALNTVNLAGDFRWTTDFNISFNRNEVTDLGPGRSEILFESVNYSDASVVLREGEPIGTFYGYEYAGAESGEFAYRDRNDDGAVTGEDRTVIGNAQPDHVGGFSNRFSYVGLELSVLLQWSYGNDIYNSNSYLYSLTGRFNQSRDVLERPSARFPGASFGNRLRNTSSDFSIEDGSYLRGKNLRLSYRVPLDKTGFGGTLRNLRVYVGAQNFFTITDYSGFDPEVSAFGQNLLTQGIDYGSYPQTRQFFAGVNIGL